MENPKSRYQFFSTTNDAWEAMFQAIQAAKQSIFWELYIFRNDEIGKRFSAVLKEKAKAGLEVKLIFDGFGSFWFDQAVVKELQEAGAEVLHFNPIRLSYLGRRLRRWFERMHRKVLIVDRCLGFIGGVNVEKTMSGWFDLQVKVEGKIIQSLLKSFSRSYLAGGGKLDRIKHLFYLPVVKEKYWRVIWHKPQSEFSILRRVYLNAIKRAKFSLTFVAPYFLPDREFLEALRLAHERGVKIDLILPWKTDHRVLTYAMRAYWRLYNRLGMKIHLVKNMIHAKAMMVDGKWAMVGSSNFDSQTFYRSHETNLVFTSREMIADLKKIFAGWRKRSRLFRPLKWERRSFVQRIYEVVCKLLRPIL